MHLDFDFKKKPKNSSKKYFLFCFQNFQTILLFNVISFRFNKVYTVLSSLFRDTSSSVKVNTI